MTDLFAQAVNLKTNPPPSQLTRLKVTNNNEDLEMGIGTGIAIAGAWVFAGMLGVSSTTSSLALLIGIVCAATVTGFLI